MISSSLKHLLITAIVLLLSACSSYTPEIPISPTEKLPTLTTVQPPSIITPIATLPSFDVIDTAVPTLTPSLSTISTAPVDMTSTVVPILIPSLNIGMTSTVNSLSLPGTLVNHLALDDKYLYWTTEGGGNLFRYALASSKDSYATIITSTQFDKGKLQMYPAPHLIRAGNC